MPDDGSPPDELGPIQFVILVLSLLLLATLTAALIFPLPAEVTRLIGFIDTAVCVVFLADFVDRFRRAPSKAAFMRWGWIDLLASVPAIPALRWGRVFRVLRIARLLLAIKSFRRLLGLLFTSKAHAGFASVFAFGFVIISGSSIAILLCEGSRGNIQTAGDALWWCLVTITTIGYGDFYPVTTAGRSVAVLTMFSGVGIFSALSGVIASVLLGSMQKEEDEILVEVRALKAEVARLRETSTPPNDPAKK
ncbi:MAG: ion transporter [Opitutus sp.]|nr:ion transporter [Opitutus sp.]